MTTLFSSQVFSFSSNKIAFEKALEEDLALLGKESPLKLACGYALLNGGKRIRPLLVLFFAHVLNQNLNTMQAALSIEYFHTASMIADDLPCMDNDDFRREKPSLHKAFGETTALLASYSLITAGFQKIYESMKQCGLPLEKAEKACCIALNEASQAAGIFGVIEGQYLDLNEANPTLDNIKNIIEKKTARFFEIACLYGWLFGGGDLDLIEFVKKIGFHFGMAFQIADDLRDYDQDLLKEKKINLAILLGKKDSFFLLEEEFEKMRTILKILKIENESFDYLQTKILKYAQGNLGA